MEIKLLILTFTLIILVAIFYSQPREFTLTSALSSNTVDSLINSLHMNGIKAQLALDRTVASSFPLNADRILEVRANGDILSIYEYTNDTLKGTEASSLSPDGTTYVTKGKVIVDDYATPAALHFYKGPNIILKYVGNSTKIISSLQMLYGNQFAGSSVNSVDICHGYS